MDEVKGLKDKLEIVENKDKDFNISKNKLIDIIFNKLNKDEQIKLMRKYKYENTQQNNERNITDEELLELSKSINTKLSENIEIRENIITLLNYYFKTNFDIEMDYEVEEVNKVNEVELDDLSNGISNIIKNNLMSEDEYIRKEIEYILIDANQGMNGVFKKYRST